MNIAKSMALPIPNPTKMPTILGWALSCSFPPITLLTIYAIQESINLVATLIIAAIATLPAFVSYIVCSTISKAALGADVDKSKQTFNLTSFFISIINLALFIAIGWRTNLQPGGIVGSLFLWFVISSIAFMVLIGIIKQRKGPFAALGSIATGLLWGASFPLSTMLPMLLIGLAEWGAAGI